LRLTYKEQEKFGLDLFGFELLKMIEEWERRI